MKAENFDQAKIEYEELEKKFNTLEETHKAVCAERDKLKDENLKTFRRLMSGGMNQHKDEDEGWNYPTI